MILKKIQLSAIVIPKIAIEKFKKNNLPFLSFQSREELINIIQNTKFDILLSNGCPYILPVSKIRKKHQIFINIHPSILPMFKGLHPVNGAKFFEKEGGATCHIMDDSVDGGSIISQVSIGNTKNLPLALIYQLSFMAELEAFKKAFELRFFPQTNQNKKQEIFFNRTEKTMHISFKEDTTPQIIRKVNAFNIPNQYSFFYFKGDKFFVKSITKITNSFLSKKYKKEQQNTIVLIYEDFILVKRRGCFVELEIKNDIEKLTLNNILEE